LASASFASRDGLGSNGPMHDTESQGSKARDHEHPRQHFVRRAHRDWRVWLVVGLMVALVLVYVFSNDLSLRFGHRAAQPTPALGGP
jgi:hypothetical protein